MLVICECGLSHEGSLGQAMAYCDAVANAGADIVKFQNHTGDPVSEFRPGTFFPQDKTRHYYWTRTSFTREEWGQLIDHAHERGIRFCVSVFSHHAIDQLDGLPVDYWKIGSAQTSNIPLIERLAGTKQPLILSSGMSDWGELECAMKAAMRIARGTVGVMHCVSEYPTPPEHVGINILDDLDKKYYPIPMGLSDHSGTIWPSIIAASKGADMCEVHVCWTKECFGPDVPASITIEELRQLVQGVRFVERMVSNPVDKDGIAKSMGSMRELFRC